MKILYVGMLDAGGTCQARLCSLQSLAPDVSTFDASAYVGWAGVPQWQRVLERYSHLGPLTSRANAALRSACRDQRPDLIWIDKGDWIWSSTVRALRHDGAFLVHHNTDALHPLRTRVRLNRRLLRATARYFDLFLTTNIDDRDRMAATSPPRTELTDLGYDQRRFDPSPLPEEIVERWDHPLIFVGHYEPRTERGVLALIDAGLPVTIFGNHHWFESPHRDRLADHLQPSLGNEDYVHALKGAKIGLCFVSEVNYNQTASRSFEIPGCGTFLLAMRTKQHLDCYEEGKEAEFFGNHRELVEKARYYLEHEDEREAIARRGHERCRTSGYSWDAIMKRDWTRVMELYKQLGPTRETLK